MYAGNSLDWRRRVCESMCGGTSLVCRGVLEGVVGVNPVCMLEGTYEGLYWELPRMFSDGFAMVPLAN